MKTIDLKTMEQVGAVAYNNGVFTGKARSANYTPTRFANKKIIVGDDTAFLGVGFRLDGSIDRDYFAKLEKNTLENRPGTAELTAYDKIIYVVDYNEQTGEARPW